MNMVNDNDTLTSQGFSPNTSDGVQKNHLIRGHLGTEWRLSLLHMIHDFMDTTHH